MLARILHRYNEANSWATINPILGEGEMGFESDTNLLKIGDGYTSWNDLAYSSAKPEDQQYFFASFARVPRYSICSNLRGKMVYAYTGTFNQRTDRLFLYLNRTNDEETICELVPASYFFEVQPDKELE